jgi:RHS repeat-associated protein
MPDGSSQTYSQPDSSVSFPRKVFLTAETDPQGNTLTFVYTDNLQLTAITDALGQVSRFTYADETSHAITSMTDPFGRTALLAYDAQGRLVSITDAIGLTSSFTYGAGDFIDSMTTPYGTTRFTTGDNGSRMWIEAQDPLGGRERAEAVIVHDSTIGPRLLPAPEVPTGFTQYNGNFDAGLTLFWGKRAMALAPNQVSSAEMTHWLEDPATHRPRGVIRAFKKPLEGRIWYAYEGQLTSHGADARLKTVARILVPGTPTSVPVEQITRYTRNRLGRVCTLTDPMGRVTRYTYTEQGFPGACVDGFGIDLEKIEQQHGAGWDVVQTMTYDSAHQPLTITDGALQTTTYTYNSAGQALTVTTPVRAEFPNEERTTTYTYDDATGYLQSVVSPGSVTTLFTYDAYGRMRTLTNNDDDTTTYDYDAFDRQTRTTHPDGTYEQVEYDRLDAHRTRDRLGRWSEGLHDALRRPLATVDPAGRIVRQEWCNCGSLDRLIDANGNATSWEYDLQGRVTKETRPNDGTGPQRSTRYFYDTLSSRLVKRIDAKLQQTTYAYALDDKLTAIAYPSISLPDPPTPGVTLSYSDPSGAIDPYGRLRRMIDGTGTTDYGYRPFGQLGAGALSVVDGPDAGPSDVITYQYDEIGRVVGRTFDGVLSTRQYDEQGRLESQTDPIGVFEYGYEGNSGRLAYLRYPNGQTSAYTYHDGSQDRLLASITHHDASNPTVFLEKFSYTYDDVGNVKTWRSESSLDPQTERTLSYDRADQLVAVNEAPLGSGGFGGAPSRRYRYTYDPAGNRTAEQIDDVVTGATYNGRNQLISQQAGGAELFFGSTNEPARVTVQTRPATITPPPANQFSGNAQVGASPTEVVVQATDFAQPANTRTNTYRVTQPGSGAKTFEYDNNGNLRRAIDTSGSTTYDWDAENRLVRVRRNAQQVAAYTYDGDGRRRTSMNHTGSLTVHTWDGPDVVQERTGTNKRRFIHGPGIDQHLAMVTDLAAVTYYLADHLGSIVRETDSLGQPALTRAYDAWGRMSQGQSTSGYAYTGREWDAASGLYYYRARYYDSGVGRFISADPSARDPHPYAYALNRPATLIDPDGQLAVPAVWMIGIKAWQFLNLTKTIFCETLLGLCRNNCRCESDYDLCLRICWEEFLECMLLRFHKPQPPPPPGGFGGGGASSDY